MSQLQLLAHATLVGIVVLFFFESLPNSFLHKEKLGFPVWNYLITLGLQLIAYPLCVLFALRFEPEQSMKWLNGGWDQLTEAQSRSSRIFWFLVAFHMAKDLRSVMHDKRLLFHHLFCFFGLCTFGLLSHCGVGVIIIVTVAMEFGSAVFNVSALTNTMAHYHVTLITISHVVGVFGVFHLSFVGQFPLFFQVISCVCMVVVCVFRHQDCFNKFREWRYSKSLYSIANTEMVDQNDCTNELIG
eukprot:c2403_g1_i1.p1 GENE.c2403_g1_i1~~c2403_g1_i1.p1  ORF type:complete len:243 (-),score=18.72 c2403_g1_i1:440-1168(-)